MSEDNKSIEKQKTLSFNIKSSKLSSFPIKETIEWPIINTTDKAYLVQTPGGDLWIPVWKIKNGIYYYADNLTELIDLITNLATNSGDHVSVVQSGAGPTQKSAKYKVKVNKKVHNKMETEFPITKIVERTFTLAKSQIKDEGGILSAPTWLFKDRLNEGESLLREKWHGLDIVVAQINQVAEIVKVRDEQATKKRDEETRVRIAEKKRINDEYIALQISRYEKK
jgi:hypothetical protein